MFDIIVRNGQVVLPSGISVTDLGLKKGKIAAIGDLGAEIGYAIDASGKLVLPGLIDPHVHIADTSGDHMRLRAPDDFYTATVAAAFGGTTTVIDFVPPVPGCTMEESIGMRRAEADGQTVIDYALHVILGRLNETILRDMADLPDLGIRSIKMALYRDDIARDESLLRVLERAQELDLLVMTHAESRDLIKRATKKLVAAGQVSARYYPQARPAVSEKEATARAIRLSEVAGNRLYVVHVSAKEALEVIRRAQANGQQVWAETTSHYLTLTDQVYERPDAANYVCAPPMRKQADQDTLWQGMREGIIHTVCSDHCGFSSAQKMQGKDDFQTVPAGLAGLETRAIIVFSEGVMRNRITLERFVDVMCTNPARIFGLYPRKGIIAPSSDADLCLVDPDVAWSITPQTLHFDWGYTPHLGLEVKGKPVIVIAGGKVVVENGEFKGNGGDGKFLRQGNHQKPWGFPPSS